MEGGSGKLRANLQIIQFLKTLKILNKTLIKKLHERNLINLKLLHSFLKKTVEVPVPQFQISTKLKNLIAIINKSSSNNSQEQSLLSLLEDLSSLKLKMKMQLFKLQTLMRRTEAIKSNFNQTIV